MEEPRNGRLNSTNNQPADPDLPSYRESVEGAGNVNGSIVEDNLLADDVGDLSEMEQDSADLIFVGPGNDANMPARTCHGNADASCPGNNSSDNS